LTAGGGDIVPLLFSRYDINPSFHQVIKERPGLLDARTLENAGFVIGN
jgi:hypothetical protein